MIEDYYRVSRTESDDANIFYGRDEPESVEALGKIREICGDKRIRYGEKSQIYKSLSNLKGICGSIIRNLENTRGLTRNQITLIDYAYEFRRRVILINDGYEEELADDSVKFLDSIKELLAANRNPSIHASIHIISKKQEQIQEGLYFWNNIFIPARTGLLKLRKKGIRDEKLDERLDWFMMRTGVEVLDYDEFQRAGLEQSVVVGG